MTKIMDIAKVWLWISCLLISFGLGAAVVRFELFPYRIMESGGAALARLYMERETLLGIRPAGLLQPARYDGAGITRNVSGGPSPGLTLISSFFGNQNELRLVRLDGTVEHRWPVRFMEVFPDVGHLSPEDVPQSEWNVTTHGALALPEGSIVFNFEYLGLAKLDLCGRVEWTLPRVTHHSLERSESGGFWVPSGRDHRDGSPFPLLSPPYWEDLILKVSDRGEVLQEISVPDLFFQNDLGSLLFANGLEAVDTASEDIAHLNDVQELTRALAEQFPAFAAGDLLLSMRNLNLIMVVDPVTHQVKWHQIGPWLKQHDADFQQNGWISVFNNNNDGTDSGSILGGSNIMEVDPSSGETRVVYGSSPSQHMYSYRRGKHQYLDETILITESESGRVFEVDHSGSIVWEFFNRYDEDFVAVVMGATRYPEDYFLVNDWTCE